MKTLFHGTTLDNLYSILANGFGGDEDKRVWTASNLNETYFYDASKHDEDENHWECINGAIENAKIAAAVQGYSGTDLVALQVEVEDNLVEDDWSCENMNEMASCVCNEDLSIDNIKKVYISRNSYHPIARCLYLAAVYNNQHFNNTLSEIEDIIVARLVKELPAIDELYEHDWEEFDCLSQGSPMPAMT